jgi:magnesium-transporting ATPase (P-type)
MPGELQSARAQTSGLNEELGLVKFIAADKTGTLTCNRMDARKAFIGQLQYGTGTTDLQAAVRAAQLASRTKAEIAADDAASFGFGSIGSELILGLIAINLLMVEWSSNACMCNATIDSESGDERG